MSRSAPVSWALVRNTVRYYWRQRRLVALVRATFLTAVLRHGSELCQECGGRYSMSLWHAPDPLWLELVGRPGGLLCPRCFERKARRVGIDLLWTPVVTGRNGVMTTNHWHDPVRDRLLMGEPDPQYHDGGIARVPQGPWGTVGSALGWDLEPYYGGR